MAVVIHRDPQLLKCLQKLLKAGGRAALAAERVETILARLAFRTDLKPVHKLTKFGERRIAGCKKFNLGGGYRLVYIQEDQHYIFLFVGTHDDCDRWLNNHKHFKPTIPDTPPPCPALQAVTIDGAVVQPGTVDDTVDDMDYDDLLMQHIDEKMLRRIFRGLYGE